MYTAFYGARGRPIHDIVLEKHKKKKDEDFDQKHMDIMKELGSSIGRFHREFADPQKKLIIPLFKL